MLTTFDLDEYVFEALRAGASGFLLKDAPAAELVARRPGGRRPATALLAPTVTRRLIAEFARRRPARRRRPRPRSTRSPPRETRGAAR